MQDFPFKTESQLNRALSMPSWGPSDLHKHITVEGMAELMTEIEWERVEIDKREEQEPACSALSQKTEGMFRKGWNADTISKSCTQRTGTGLVLEQVLLCSSWTALIDKSTPKARIKKESVTQLLIIWPFVHRGKLMFFSIIGSYTHTHSERWLLRDFSVCIYKKKKIMTHQGSCLIFPRFNSGKL